MQRAWDNDDDNDGGPDSGTQIVVAKIESVQEIEEGEDETAFDMHVTTTTAATTTTATTAFMSPSHSLSSFRQKRKKKRREIVLSPRELDSPAPKSTVSAPAFLSSPGRSSVDSIRGREEVKGSERIRADTPASLSSHPRSMGDQSLEGASRSYTPLSDTRSYKERIRDRVQSVREQTTSALVEAHQQSRSKKKIRTRTTSRFDALLQKEEARVGEALEKHETVRSQWKGEGAEQTKERIASAAERYDFFTRVWDSDDSEEMEPATVSSPPETGEEEGGTADKTKLITADYLGLKDEWELVENAPAAVGDEEEITSRLKDLIFFPDSKPVPFEDKFPPGEGPRYPEDEGLYFGSPLPVAPSMRNKMEQRILAAGDTEWFGDDGEIITLPDPLWSTPRRPPVFEDVNPHLESVYQPAVPSDLDGHTLQSVDVDSKCVLDLEIASVVFQHHPLFSSEHVLAQRLQDLHEMYVKRAAQKLETRLEERLDALRRARSTFREAVDGTVTKNSEQTERLKRYIKDIREARQLLHRECRRSRCLLVSVLDAWRELKKLRKSQGYSNTSVRLRIHAQRAEGEVLEEEQRQWDERIRMEWQEREEEAMEEHNKQRKEYKKQLHRWRKERKARHEAQRKRQKAAEEVIEAEEEEASSEAGSEDRPPLPQEPEPPQEVDWATLRSDMMQQLMESFRPPGEPKITLSLEHTGKVTASPKNNVREQQRRLAVNRCGLSFRLLYNGVEVCCSDKEPLGPRFQVRFGKRLSVCVVQRPESLKAELYEEGSSLGKTLMGEVFIPIPCHTTVLDSELYERLEFSNSLVVTYSHAGVGSGTFTSISSASSSCLYTAGVLTYRAGWAVDRISGKTLAPPERYCRHESRENPNFSESFNIRKGSVDLEKVKKWAESSPLDRNEPANSEFFTLLNSVPVDTTAERNVFRLNPLQSKFDFCMPEKLQNNRRLRLLYLRDRGEPEFRSIGQVPLRERGIPADIFKAYEQRLASPHIDLESTSMDPLDAHRAWGQRFLLEIRQRVLKQCRLAQQHKKLQDIVVEDQVPDIGTLGLTFMQWFRPKRPLRPARKERKKVTVQSLGGQEVKLIINIVRAFDVPVRKDTDTMLPRAPSSVQQGHRFATVPVKPFVEATFQGESARTRTANGNNPTWNQEVQLPLRPPSGDFSPGSLEEIQDALHLHLFDEIVVDLLEDDRVRETNIHKRLERNWLGSLRIPFTTLYYNSRIEGTFKLYSPPVLLGYERVPQHRQFSGYYGEMQTFPLLQPNATFLSLFITVQPALNPPEPFKEQLQSSEPGYLQEHLQAWEQQVISQYPNRRPKTLVVDISGKSVCVTRFIRPLAPPVVQEGALANENMAARFVAMIPMVAGSMLFPGLFDIWLTSDQVLRLLSGDAEDHAVLLCCYLLHLSLEAWVLLGSGAPHGPTAYVLQKQEKGDDYVLWDPASGQSYDIRGNFCPLRKVYCVFNDDNIWANIQNEEPLRMRFDVSRRSDWLPAFGRSVPAPATSVQPSVLAYTPTSESAVLLLQDKIEAHLRESLMKWRRTARTLWNRYCVAILRKLLPALEEETWSLDDSSQHTDHLRELQHILASHKMCGFPINLPYTNMAAITESVKATGVHFCESPQVEFALAVYIHPYPNNVLSVWVYVASLVRRR